ncbi:MAG: glycosyltransferase family 2 protein [Candidatus Margulisbacteria bacterium]|nr:glycosyltransferase family 2 protein [Candidatus Margulisiibacteriota bacterium]
MTKNLLIIPFFNEEKTIKPVLNEIIKYYCDDILLIDDGSTDLSRCVVEALNRKDIMMIKHKKNQGYGKSLIDGFNYAIVNGYNLAITMDCDAQHEPSQIPAFIKNSVTADIVSGSRYLKEYTQNLDAPEDRFRINKIVTQALNKVLATKITDAFCGFKAYSINSLKKLKLTEKGYALPLQLLVQVAFLKLELTELPVPRLYFHAERSFGKILDDPDARLRYYLQTIEKEVKKWKSI